MKPFAFVFTLLLGSTVAAAADSPDAALDSRDFAHLPDHLRRALEGGHKGSKRELDDAGQEIFLSREVGLAKNAMLSLSPKQNIELRHLTKDLHYHRAEELDQALKNMTTVQSRQLKKALMTCSAGPIGNLLAAIMHPIPVVGQSLADLFSSLFLLTKDLAPYVVLQAGPASHLLSEILHEIAVTVKHQSVKPEGSLLDVTTEELLADVLDGIAVFLGNLPKSPELDEDGIPITTSSTSAPTATAAAA